MIFRRKPKNRRLDREQVLDVKLRSGQVRAARLRLVSLALGSAVATVVGLYLLWRAGDWALERLVYDNKSFALEKLDIQTDGIIAIGQLRRWSGLKLGQNLIALDLGRVKRDLQLVPLIESASIERILPHSLHIRVTERQPIAQVNLPRPRPQGGIDMAVLLVDPDGFVMPPLEPSQRGKPMNPAGEELPVLSGISSSDMQTARRLELPQVQAALDLLIAFESSPMAALVDLKRIDVSTSEILLATTSQGSEVSFGLAGLELQLRRWHEIFVQGQKMGKAIAELDLAVTNNIPARWLEASTVPPVTPKGNKLLHVRKKHV